MIKTVYVDMDGVLANFEEGFKQFSEANPQLAKGDVWDEFIAQDGFAKLPVLPDAEELLFWLANEGSYPVDLVILSSSGRPESRLKIAKQKLDWLEKNNLSAYFVDVVIVPNKSAKQYYAEKRSLLIDDHPNNVLDFRERRGKAVLHYNTAQTKETIKKRFLW
jgi:FMN phosphatase YigB (HAD superfamily)